MLKFDYFLKHEKLLAFYLLWSINVTLPLFFLMIFCEIGYSFTDMFRTVYEQW